MWINITKLFRKVNGGRCYICKGVGVYFFVFIFALLALIWVVPCHNDGLFEVREGESVFQITENLKQQGFIQTKIPFYFYVFLEGGAKDLKYGVYKFTTKDTFLSIAKKIIQGKVYTIKITIPEGYNIKQIDERLAEAGLIKSGELINFNLSELDVPYLEGFLFPDTYYFSPSADTEEIVNVFLDNFDKKIAPYRNEISDSGLTVPQIVTMASLIEKEVRTVEDKRLVAGILWKRLENNIPLQVDATITYITGKKTTEISGAETKIDSPYNTYKYKGLPKGPICNPGLDSILATIYPEDSSAWYYLSTPEGKTIFSKTLEEHNINKSKYLNNMAKKIAIIIAFRDFRDVEYFIPKNTFVQAGAAITTVSKEKGTAIGADGGEVKVDLTLEELNPSDFDAVVFIGGSGMAKNIDSEIHHKIARETVEAGKVLGAICISPAVLAKAGILDGKKATVWSSPMDKSAVKILQEQGAIYQNEPVVVDGKIVTGNGPMAAKEFAETLTEMLK